MNNKKEFVKNKNIDQMLTEMVDEILSRNERTDNLAVVGIKTRGEYLARRIIKKIEDIKNTVIPYGAIDITLYRDDFRKKKDWPILKKTEIDFDVQGVNIILVDDVIFTGRTVRAALGALMDFGRPLSVQLAVLVDRGHRELPIQPDYTGMKIDTGLDQQVRVLLQEYDNEEGIIVE